jgi:hypothetical protein
MSEELANDFRVAVYHRSGVVEAEEIIRLLKDSHGGVVFFDAGEHHSNWEGDKESYGPHDLSILPFQSAEPSHFSILLDHVRMTHAVFYYEQPPLAVTSRDADPLRAMDLDTVSVLAYFATFALVQHIIKEESGIVEDSPSWGTLGSLGWRSLIENGNLPQHEAELIKQTISHNRIYGPAAQACETILRNIASRCKTIADHRSHEDEFVSKAHAELAHGIETVLGFDLESLIRTEQLGTTYHFEPVRAHIEGMLRTIDELGQSRLEKLPTRTLWSLSKLMRRVEFLFLDMKNFMPRDSVDFPDPKAAWDKIGEAIYNTSSDCFDEIAPILAFLKADSQDMRAQLNEFHKATQELRDQATDTLARMKSCENETGAILDAVKKAAEEVGVTGEAKHFKEAAKKHSNAAWMWLGLTTASIGLLAGLAYWNLQYHMNDYQPGSWGKAVPFMVAKVIAFSVLYFLVVALLKNYRANRHNCVLNEHRANALSTFETFALSAKDPAVKDAILTTATESVFATRQTGYLQDEPVQQSAPQILEIIRNGLSTGDGK